MTPHRKVENNLMETIAMTFGFDWTLHKSVKNADRIALQREIADLMPSHELFDSVGKAPEGVRLVPWKPMMAYDMFLLAYREIEARNLVAS